MKKMVFITGGARSGKSAFSEEKAKELGSDLVYVATMEPLDEEMRLRIKKHVGRRGKEWKTVEEPLQVAGIIKKNDREGRVFLLDCLTLFISNNMLKGLSEEEILSKAEELAEIGRSCKASIVIVSNETGMGLVPENEMGRKFRDVQGKANQIVAAAADEAYFLVAGLPIKLK